MPTHNDIIKRVRRFAAVSAALAALLLVAPLASAGGEEIHSNGRGGGLWSEPETWHGNRVPGPEDTVVIAMRDRVEFDRDDREEPTCGALYLDPEAVLTFREGRHRRTLSVAGPVESYGTIRVDGTGDRRGQYEIRLVAEGPSVEQRTIHLRENAGLMLYGHEQHRGNQRNVRLIAGREIDPEADDETQIERIPGRIVADGDVMFDVHHAHVHDVEIELANLDNSGGTRERLNIIGCYLTGHTTLRLENCDTPVVRNSHFHTDDDAEPYQAVRLVDNDLAQLTNNRFEGPYNRALHINPDNNSTIADTEIVGVTNRGMYLRSVTDTAIRNVRIDGEGASTGIWVQSSRGGALLERVRVRDVEQAFRFRHSRAQLSDCSAEGLRVEEEGDPGVALYLYRSSVRLINSPFDPDEIEINDGGSPPGDDPYLQTMQHVIVRVVPAEKADDADAEAELEQRAERAAQAGQAGQSGQAGQAMSRRQHGMSELDLPPGLQVRLQTAEESGGVPEGRADLNVRNSPVPVSRTTGLTPLPRSQRALAVQSWRYDRDAEFRQAPFYELIVEARTGEDGAHETLVSRTIEPGVDWFRANPNAPEPTVEVRLP